jgi:hypothetical protein
MNTFREIERLAEAIANECSKHKDNESAYIISTRINFIMHNIKEMENIVDKRRRNLALSYDD